MDTEPVLDAEVSHTEVYCVADGYQRERIHVMARYISQIPPVPLLPRRAGIRIYACPLRARARSCEQYENMHFQIPGCAAAASRTLKGWGGDLSRSLSKDVSRTRYAHLQVVEVYVDAPVLRHEAFNGLHLRRAAPVRRDIRDSRCGSPSAVFIDFRRDPMSRRSAAALSHRRSLRTPFPASSRCGWRRAASIGCGSQL
jgi:hypothetical protein